MGPMTPRDSMSPMAQYLALAAIFSAGVFGYLMRAFDWLHAIPGDLVDARFNSIILEHLYLWVSGHAPSLWSPGYFYPFEGALAFSDNHFGSGGVYVASRWLGLSREQAFQAWFIAGSTLNFWATYYALRKLGFSIVSAGAGAFVYAFGLPSLAKEGHAQLTYRFAVPLAFASFYRALSLKSVSDLALAAFWCAFQFFCSIYLGIFLVYLLAGTFLACWIAYGRTLAQGWLVAWSRAQWTTRALSLALLVASAAALAWLLWMYQTIAAHYGLVRSSKEVFSMLPRPGSYLLADWSGLSSWVGRLVTQVPMRHEQQMFFGLGAWILALAGLSQIRARLHAAALVQVAAIALVFLVGLTLLIGNVTAYRAILHLPGVGSVRAVSRIVLVMLLPGAILVAAAFDWAAKSASVRGWRRLPLMLILMTLLTAETAAYRSNNTPVSAWLGRRPHPVPDGKARDPEPGSRRGRWHYSGSGPAVDDTQWILWQLAAGPLAGGVLPALQKQARQLFCVQARSGPTNRGTGGARGCDFARSVPRRTVDARHDGGRSGIGDTRGRLHSFRDDHQWETACGSLCHQPFTKRVCDCVDQGTGAIVVALCSAGRCRQRG